MVNNNGDSIGFFPRKTVKACHNFTSCISRTIVIGLFGVTKAIKIVFTALIINYIADALMHSEEVKF